MEPKSTLIIGYGNTLRGDDGVGFSLAERIAALAWPHCRALAVHQLTPELAPAIAAGERVIFLDAQLRSEVNQPLATIERLEPKTNPGAMGHRSSPGELLALAKILYGVEVEAWWILITAVNFDYGETLSPITTAAQEEALLKIEQLLAKP